MPRIFVFLFLLYVVSCGPTTSTLAVAPTSPQVTFRHGDITRGNEVAPRDTGFTLARFVSTCSDETATFGYRYAYPETANCLHVMDAALEMYSANGLPYYRIWLIDRNVPASRLQALPPYFSLIAHNASGGAQRFVAKLPDDRSTLSSWGLATDWTLCLTCVGYTNDGRPDPKKTTRLSNALAFAGRASGYDPTIGIKFTSSPEASIVIGQGALDRVDALTGAQVPRPRDYAEASLEYKAFLRTYKSQSLAGQLEQKCGRVRCSGGLGVAGGGTSAQLIAESRAEIEGVKRGLAKFEQCAANFLKTFNTRGYSAQLKTAIEMEETLAKDAGEYKSADRTPISFQAELDDVKTFIKRQQNNAREYVRNELESIDSNQEIAAYEAYERARPKVNYGALVANATGQFNRDLAKQNAAATGPSYTPNRSGASITLTERTPDPAPQPVSATAEPSRCEAGTQYRENVGCMSDASWAELQELKARNDAARCRSTPTGSCPR